MSWFFFLLGAANKVKKKNNFAALAVELGNHLGAKAISSGQFVRAITVKLQFDYKNWHLNWHLNW